MVMSITRRRQSTMRLDMECGGEPASVEDRMRGKHKKLTPERKKQMLDLTHLPPSKMVRSIFEIYSATTGQPNEYSEQYDIEPHSGTPSHWALNGGNFRPPMIVGDAVADINLIMADVLDMSQADVLREAMRAYLEKIGDPMSLLRFVDMTDAEYEEDMRRKNPDLAWE